MVAQLVEVCGDSEVAWRTAVALADSESTLGFDEVAALVAVGCTESLGQ